MGKKGAKIIFDLLNTVSDVITVLIKDTSNGIFQKMKQKRKKKKEKLREKKRRDYCFAKLVYVCV